ncbi:hypothetical protein [Polaribacter sp. Hel_I_88]|uniref:hypothetical protein n=1 Tax=Polaribacter sp. Hel_I_88 TaxID=1250006 RepID=UPI000A81F3DD|nr:hypothetical protein [Polaribacter sp. Hel_I_88]
MKKIVHPIILLLILTTFSCKSQSNSENKMTEFQKETLEKENYDRYILVRGRNLKDVEPKIIEWAEIFGAGESVNMTIQKSELGDWTILKLPKNEILTAYNYHNFVYWFLGTPPEDQNYADFSIGISIDKNGQSTYLIYNDYDLRSEIATDDDVFGIFKSNQKFILSIPFDEMKPTENKNILDFNKFLSNENIDISKIQTDRLEWKNIEIKI